MATLSTTEKSEIRSLITYLRDAHDLPIDPRVTNTLALMQTKFGYGGPGNAGIQEALRDQPIRTLLVALLAVAA